MMDSSPQLMRFNSKVYKSLYDSVREEIGDGPAIFNMFVADNMDLAFRYCRGVRNDQPLRVMTEDDEYILNHMNEIFDFIGIEASDKKIEVCVELDAKEKTNIESLLETHDLRQEFMNAVLATGLLFSRCKRKGHTLYFTDDDKYFGRIIVEAEHALGKELEKPKYPFH